MAMVNHHLSLSLKRSTVPALIFLVRSQHHNSIPTAFAFYSPKVVSPTQTRTMMLTRRTPEQVQLEIKDPVDPTALAQAKAILDELRPETQTACSPDALLSIAGRLGDIPKDQGSNNGSGSYIVSPSECRAAFDSLDDDERKSLLNIHDRVKVFAEAQRRSVVDVEVDIPGGKSGQSVSPCRGTLHVALLSFCVFDFSCYWYHHLGWVQLGVRCHTTGAIY